MTSWKNNNTLESRRLAEEILNPSKKARKSRKVVVESLPQLRKLIDDRVREFGPNCDLNDLDVSHITSMNRLFYGSDFNGNISKWDVSSVKDMAEMFAYSKFKGNISRWDRHLLPIRDGLSQTFPHIVTFQEAMLLLFVYGRGS